MGPGDSGQLPHSPWGLGLDRDLFVCMCVCTCVQKAAGRSEDSGPATGGICIVHVYF